MRPLRCVALVLGLALLAPEVARADAPRVPTYPTLAPHPDLVMAGPYDSVASGDANWGTGLDGALHSREFLTLGNQYRLRQSGTLRRIRLNVQDAAGLTGFTFRIWRKIGSTYDLVGSSENLAPRMTAGVNTLDLERPIVVQEGDYYGYRVESTGAANFVARARRPGVATYSGVDAAVPGSDFNWQAQPVASGSILPIEMYLQAPILVAIGDGLVIGHLDHHTFVVPHSTKEPGTDLLSLLGERWRVTRQNLGAHAQMGGRGSPQQCRHPAGGADDCGPVHRA